LLIVLCRLLDRVDQRGRRLAVCLRRLDGGSRPSVRPGGTAPADAQSSARAAVALADTNGWTLAEAAGDQTPDKLQRLLNAACWDVDEVRDDLRGYVAA
jgi:hypothetical protein